MIRIKTIQFTKMQGIGNDYVYIDCTKKELDADISDLAKKISDRHFGVGSDGLVLILGSEKADFMMRMFNSDGTEAEMCGNAVRCVGKFVYDRGLTSKTTVTIDTLAGIKTLELNIKDGVVSSARVDMGEPILEPKKIPVNSDSERFISEEVDVDGVTYKITCVSVGNPHAVIYVDDVKNLEIEKIGPKVENHKMFPRRINTEFIKVLDRKTLEMRVWERGAGETLACGTGASAALVATVLNDLCDRKAVLKLLGGDLEIEWKESDNRVYLTGPAEFVFDGEYFY